MDAGQDQGVIDGDRWHLVLLQQSITHACPAGTGGARPASALTVIERATFLPWDAARPGAIPPGCVPDLGAVPPGCDFGWVRRRLGAARLGVIPPGCVPDLGAILPGRDPAGHSDGAELSRGHCLRR